MKRRVLAVLGGGVLSACFFGKVPETKYYMLDYQPTPPPERLQKGPYPFVLRLREPTIAETYRRSQIVYRQSAYQIQFYSYHLWSVDPDRMIGDLLLKHLRAARLFDNVIRSTDSFAPDFQLTCDVQAIEEYDGPGGTWYAHLALEYQLIEEKNGQVLWKKLYDLRKTVSQQEPVYVVRELSALLETAHERLSQDLEVALDEAKFRAAPGK
jgi:cholesterol transport system auxiliary component